MVIERNHQSDDITLYKRSDAYKLDND